MTAIRDGRAGDVDTVRRIAGAAGRRFASVTDPRIAARADDPPPDPELVRDLAGSGRLLVAEDDTTGAVVGFLMLDVVDGNAHVEEVSVDPAHGGHGHGTALVAAAGSRAVREGRRALTLTTFADVAWNRPWYERLGFVVLPTRWWGPELARRVADEAAHGLDPTLRVAMQKPLPASAGDDPGRV